MNLRKKCETCAVKIRNNLIKRQSRGFPGGPVVTPPFLRCRGNRTDPTFQKSLKFLIKKDNPVNNEQSVLIVVFSPKTNIMPISS